MMKTLAAARPVLSAQVLAELIREAGVPCVTVVADEAAAAAIPATPRDEGLRIVAGSMPVRVAYPIPVRDSDDDGLFWAALSRHDDHVLWLYEFVEQYRWSADRDGPHADPWITISPEPRPATYTDGRGRECSRATGLPMDGDRARWAVLTTIEDPGAFADWITQDVEAEIAAAGKLRASREYLGQFRLRDAERIRAAGPHATCDSDYYHDDAQAQAEARARSLARLGHPGVRYEAAPVTGYASCRTCLHPVVEATGRWWHRNGDCPGPRKIRDIPAEPGDWVIDTGAGTMTCGYCGLTEHWLEADRSWVRLTGVHSLGVQLEVPETGHGASGQVGDLVVLAEVEWMVRWPGRRDLLPHHCAKIPAQIRAEYAGDITAALAKRRAAGDQGHQRAGQANAESADRVPSAKVDEGTRAALSGSWRQYLQGLAAVGSSADPLNREAPAETLLAEVEAWSRQGPWPGGLFKREPARVLVLTRFGGSGSNLSRAVARRLAAGSLQDKPEVPLPLRISLAGRRDGEGSRELVARHLRRAGLTIADWHLLELPSLVIIDGLDELLPAGRPLPAREQLGLLGELCSYELSHSRIALVTERQPDDSRLWQLILDRLDSGTRLITVLDTISSALIPGRPASGGSLSPALR